jgi:phosphatidylserine/phosphatidylglycerophosphate/cardiolipin synthase-like enzyme
MLLIDLARDTAKPAAAIRRVAPEADELTVIAYVPERKLPWLASEEDQSPALVEQLRSSTAGAARDVHLILAPELDPSAVTGLTRDAKVDLIVLSQPGLAVLSVAAEARKECALPVLYVAPTAAPEAALEEAHVFGPLLFARPWRAPVLVAPPLPLEVALARPIDVPDVVNDGGMLRVRILFSSGVGRHEPIPDQEVTFVVGGTTSVVTTRDGFAEIPFAQSDRIGVYRTAEKRIEHEARVVTPGSRPLVLFDSDADLSTIATTRDADLLAVRMRPMRSCRDIRDALRAAGLEARVVDASAVLDEGQALDVGEDLDAVRLARVAAKMRRAGFSVEAVVDRGGPGPRRVEETRHELTQGNRIEIEFDNAKARHWLLDGIANAKRRVHVQVYMAADDDVGSAVEAALAAAGARGVVVRVVVDSLHGLEGSLGAHNPLLERLRARPAVELRLIRPITGAPTLEELKQRDHRKLAVMDGTVGLLGGRNLSHEYYAGFEEVNLTADSLWRQVPWLDGGARVEGPAVAALERSFLDAWTAAGGAPFDIETPPPAGSAAARVVVHHGLRDANTLDTYLALIDGAKSHVNAVNGFPMMLEIQHAMLRAVRRGVRVRVVVGNLTPNHNGIPFKGPWSDARVATTEFVHSRVDPVVAAGGEGYIYAVSELPNWQRGLGTIYPHVHAKVMTVDGRVASVGSANLDFTAAYWENELLLVVEDAAIAGALEARIDELIAASKPIDRNDPAWQQTARRRGWLRRWPGLLSI